RYNFDNGFSLNSQSIYFNKNTEELTLNLSYIHAPTNTYLPLTVEKNLKNNRFEDTLNKLSDTKPLEKINGYYGYIEKEGKKHYQFIAEEDGVTYSFEDFIGHNTALDSELIAMMGDSLKTEKDGAISHFYDRFSFRLNDLHFPKIKKDDVENVEVEIRDLGHWAFDNSNIIEVTYDFGDDTYVKFSNAGMDLYNNNVGFEKLEEEHTEGGVTVTSFDDVYVEDRTIYFWEADGHYYIIVLDSPNEHFSKEDIYEIIDSSREDRRPFTNINVFKAQNEGPVHSGLDKKIHDYLLNHVD